MFDCLDEDHHELDAMIKRLAGPAGAVWALNVCEFEGEKRSDWVGHGGRFMIGY